jgi:hypothetical protein
MNYPITKQQYIKYDLVPFYNDFDNEVMEILVNGNFLPTHITPLKAISFIYYNENILFDASIETLESNGVPAFKIHQEIINFFQSIDPTYEEFEEINIEQIEKNLKNDKLYNLYNITFKIYNKFCKFIQNEINHNENFCDLKYVMDAIENIEDENLMLCDYNDWFIYRLKTYLEEELRELKINVWILQQQPARRIRAIKKIEDYFLRAYYSPTNEIGKRRLEKSIEELYE